MATVALRRYGHVGCGLSDAWQPCPMLHRPRTAESCKQDWMGTDLGNLVLTFNASIQCRRSLSLSLILLVFSAYLSLPLFFSRPVPSAAGNSCFYVCQVTLAWASLAVCHDLECMYCYWQMLYTPDPTLFIVVYHARVGEQAAEASVLFCTHTKRPPIRDMSALL